MNNRAAHAPLPALAAIACGGTGGHLFPGIAVGRELRRAGCRVKLLVSSKSVDARAAQTAGDLDIRALPVMGFSARRAPRFAWRFCQSYLISLRLFRERPPTVALGMGGFASVAPLLAAKRSGARVFLHEANSVPGRANRWLARIADGVFINFDSAADLLRRCPVERVGMPVRDEFLHPVSSAEARAALGLPANAPTLLVIGGSQGASGINEMILGVLPQLRAALPNLQFIHVAGESDFEKVRAAHQAAGGVAVVRPFLDEMAAAMAAADAAVSRAGASSIAEIAVCKVPSILIPYPSAADNHQFHNANPLARSGAARVVEQDVFAAQLLAREILDLLGDASRRETMRRALADWRRPDAAARIADRMLHWAETGSAVAANGTTNASPPKLGVLNV